MESSAGNKEDSMNSSEEVDDQQENDDDEESSAGKSYDCIFCKRGFTNAQALGGHMNIHRKDRAKNNSPSSFINSSKIEENYSPSPIFYQPISSYPLHYYSAPHETQQISYQTCFPASVSGEKPFSYDHHANDHQNYPQSLNHSFGDLGNWQMGLNFQYDSWQSEDDEKKKRGAIEEDGLDLELRLGQDP